MNSILRTALALLIVSSCALCQALTTYTVNQAGGGDYNSLASCLTAINGGSDTEYTVHFNDGAAVTYTIDETTIRDGVKLTFTADAADRVTVDGRMNVAQAGGTFTATNIHFKLSSGWVFLHGYDGQTYTNCTFGPSPDNGVVFRGGNNTVTNCTFTGVKNSPVMASGGITNVNNCTWVSCGRIALAQNTGDNDPTHKLIINGGSATANQFGYGFILTGFRMVVNNFTTTGFAAVATHDWEAGTDGSAGTMELNNCTFRGIYDRAVSYYQNATNADNKGSTITLNRCLLEARAESVADLVVMDARGNGDDGTIVVKDSVLRHLTTQKVASGVVCWGGGKIFVRNTVIDGTANSLLVTSQDYGTNVYLEADHCVIVNAKSQALGAGDYVGTKFKVVNTIVDASNAEGLNGDGANVESEIHHNLINVSGTTDGTNVATGDPLFVNRSTADYHIQAGSSCIGKGVATALKLDIDGEAYSTTVPDIGLDQITAVVTPTPGETPNSAKNWSIY